MQSIFFSFKKFAVPLVAEILKPRLFKFLTCSYTNCLSVFLTDTYKLPFMGKSTFAVNYAVALKNIGYKVGILDADIYGPSVPRMMGVSDKPHTNENNKLIPIESYGVKCMSIGFLINVVLGLRNFFLGKNN